MNKKPAKKTNDLMIFILIKSPDLIMPNPYTTKYGTYSYGKIIASEQALTAYAKGIGEKPASIASKHNGSIIKEQIANGVITKLSPKTITKVLPINKVGAVLPAKSVIQRFFKASPKPMLPATVPILMHAAIKNSIVTFIFLKVL